MAVASKVRLVKEVEHARRKERPGRIGRHAVAMAEPLHGQQGMDVVDQAVADPTPEPGCQCST